MLRSHVLSLILFSVLVSLFFATLYRNDAKGFLRSFLKTFLWMVFGSLGFAYLMLFTGK